MSYTVNVSSLLATSVHLVQLADLTPGRLPYKSDGDARRLILGCKLQILVSLRVSLSTVHKEIYKKMPFV